MLSGPLAATPWEQHGALQVTRENPHYIQHADGTPFWWFADTAWDLVLQASRSEVGVYLDDRAAKGFNVIQTVILSEHLRLKDTNVYGARALRDLAVDQPLLQGPGSGYWEHVDYVVDAAAQRGLYIGLLPTWGEWVVPRNGNPLFKTAAQAYGYGNFIGRRYAKKPNIVWILGGDRGPKERPEGVALWRAMAEGLADGINGLSSQDGRADYGTTLMTHHAFSSSSTWFHRDSWIDFHMWGSYHAEFDNTRSWEQAEADWNLDEPKPTLNGEPCYEAHRLNYAVPDNGVFTSTDVRVAAYWSVFSGACGFTYGADGIWQFTKPGRVGGSASTLKSWHEALDLPGATHVIHLKRLLVSRPARSLRPAREVIADGGGHPARRTVVLRGASHLFAYIPTGNDLTLNLGVLTGTELRAWWFNPRSGDATEIGTLPNEGKHTFRVPAMSKELTWLRNGRGCDWVLVLDDASQPVGKPGGTC